MSRSCEVIIIGAGIAGISCANKLKEEGITNVIILEGRDRLGGRVRTDYDLFGIPLDLGASWLHGFEDTPELADLAKVHNVKLEEKSDGKVAIFDMEKGEVDVLEFVEVSENLSSFFRHITPELQKKEKVSIRTAITLFPQEYKKIMYTEEEVADIHLQTRKDRIIEFALQAIEVYNASNVEVMSALCVDTFEPEGDKHVIDGYDKLIKGISSGLDVRLRHIVSKIEYNMNTSNRLSTQNNVTVTTDKGVFTAAYCCVTLPLGVLKADKVTFSPPLPQWKRDAIECVGFGLMDKVILQFESPVPLWDTNTEYIGILPHQKLKNISPNNNNKSGTEVGGLPHLHHMFGWMYNLDTLFPGSATYVWYVSGEFAEYLESLTNTEVAELALKELNQVRDWMQEKSKVKLSSIPPLKKCRVTRWKMDQFSLGAYSFVHASAKPEDFEKLGEPVGNCVAFAGEATSSKQYGMVNCAFETGKRAARTISQWCKSGHSKL